MSNAVLRSPAALVAWLSLCLGLVPATAGAQGTGPRVSPGDTVRPVIEHLAGSQQSPGLFAERQKFAHSYRQPPQWHDQELHVTVLHGALYAGRGDHFSLKGVRPLGPESFLIIPAKVHHFWWAPRGTVLQVEGVGPVVTTDVAPTQRGPAKP
jgi:hypothetical protein